MATYTGKKWYVEDPQPEDVCIADIAHGLSNICRFGGQCRVFYSVGQHSVLVARAILDRWGNPDHALQGILHDAAEAYLGDMVRPLKYAMPAYQALEEKTAIVIRQGLCVPEPDEDALSHVKEIDDVLLMTERRDLMNHCGHEWTPRAKPLDKAIQPWIPDRARHEFLKFYGIVMPRRKAMTNDQ